MKIIKRKVTPRPSPPFTPGESGFVLLLCSTEECRKLIDAVDALSREQDGKQFVMRPVLVEAAYGKLQ